MSFTPPTPSRAPTPDSDEPCGTEATPATSRQPSKPCLAATARHTNPSNPTGKTNGWKTTLNTLTIHYGDRIADHIQ